mmetsp:Transcript_18332/g.25854  ORF Transcript_18332/g.25854 Transcript_18332/m.25854 type:complete len:495 (-) Transcript_18332:13-1497(-)
MGSSLSKPKSEISTNDAVSGKDITPQIIKEEVATENSVSEETKPSGCPMKKSDGSYSYNFGALLKFGRDRHPPLVDKQQQKTAGEKVESKADGGGCPVKHSTPPPSSEGGCPVKQNSKQQKQQYNVYSQPIDPKNQMPNLNQLPSPQQSEELPVERVTSTIPKGGADDGTTWTYPSPQMFYNALARKGKLGDTEESDIESVVALHNNMNEKTWQKVLEWEEVLDGGAQGAPKLLKFLGRPSDLSPKAQFKHWVLGHPLPFDRHDWTVLREDGTEVRYVIDYYHDETKASESEDSAMPHMRDFEATPSLLVDVRPALDGPTELIDRCFRMPYARHIAKSTPFEPMSMLPTSEMKTQVGESLKVWENIQQAAKEKKQKAVQEAPVALPDISEKEAVKLAQNFASVLKDCREAQRAVDACESEEDMARASMALTMCMAKIVCPLQHKALTDTLHDEQAADSLLDAALENVSVCVAGANQSVAVAKRDYPSAFNDISK